MGGRSRQSRQQFTGVFAFVSDLSNERLNAYGQMTSARIQNLQDFGVTMTGKPINNDPFNAALAKEFERRNPGEVAPWDVQINGAYDNRQQSLQAAQVRENERNKK